VFRGKQVQQEHREYRESREKPGLRVLKVCREILVLREPQAHKVIPVPQALREKQVPPVLKVQQGS
jgi:hypothetical protein